MASWSFVARVAGLLREGDPIVGIEERANECEVLAPLVTSSGCRVTNVALETEVGRQLQGTLLEAALVLPGGGQPCIVIRCPSELNGGASCEEVLPIARLLLSLNICVFALDISSSHMYCDASGIEDSEPRGAGRFRRRRAPTATSSRASPSGGARPARTRR